MQRLVVAEAGALRPAQGARPQRSLHIVYAVAGPPCYALDSTESNDPWNSSHLELRAASRARPLPGYGWIFPLGGGQVNVGVGALATTKRPADIAIKPLMKRYTDERARRLRPHRRAAAPTSAASRHGRRA